jgi:hypothetical protein|nr:MAG TPA: hypothetical protein [Bacteriophage sp.]
MNEYIIVPTSILEGVDKELEYRRKSVDGAQMILHIEIYNELFPPVAPLADGLDDNPITYPYSVYDQDDAQELLSGKEWTKEDKEI